MAKLICIVCPKGCHLTVDETTLSVCGNGCPRGAEYGKNELVSPVRVVTSTVKIEGGEISRLPVRTDKAVPKSKMFEIMEQIHAVKAVSPVRIGDVIIKDICSTGADLIATRNV